MNGARADLEPRCFFERFLWSVSVCVSVPVLSCCETIVARIRRVIRASAVALGHVVMMTAGMRSTWTRLLAPPILCRSESTLRSTGIPVKASATNQDPLCAVPQCRSFASLDCCALRTALKDHGCVSNQLRLPWPRAEYRTGRGSLSKEVCSTALAGERLAYRNFWSLSRRNHLHSGSV